MNEMVEYILIMVLGLSIALAAMVMGTYLILNGNHNTVPIGVLVYALAANMAYKTVMY